MELAILGVLVGQLGVLGGIYLRLGGHGADIKWLKSAVEEVKDRVTTLERQRHGHS